MRNAAWSLVLSVALAGTATLASAGSAAANGYCFDPTQASACAISTNSTLSGSLASGTEHDYYIFYVGHQTDLTVTITDVENPGCDNSCGYVQATVYDRRGNSVANSSLSFPEQGVDVPQPFEAVIQRGVYYVDVTGNAGQPDTPPTVPYQLTVTGNPAVQAPPCIVPRLARHTQLGLAERLLGRAHCKVGKIHHMRRPGARRGEVVRLSPHAHSFLPYGARVAIYVWGGPRRHR